MCNIGDKCELCANWAAACVLSFSRLPDFLHIHTYYIHTLAYFTESRLTVWFFATQLLTGSKRTVSEAWRSAASFCIATVRIRGFRDSIEAFRVVHRTVRRTVYPVLRAGWLNVCRTHGPAILSSSLIVPTAALNHIYLSGNQAASTMEAVHLSRRGAFLRSTRGVSSMGREKTRNHRPFGQSCSAITLIASEVRGVACLHELTERLPTVCPSVAGYRGWLSISRFLRNSITGRTIGLIRSLITPVDDDWVRWASPPRLSFPP